jgi:hypothetical protein
VSILDEQQHVALPKLYGAPAYARPPAVVPETPKPFDVDDLPIEAYRDDEDRAFAASLPARAWAAGGMTVSTSMGDGSRAAMQTLVPQPLSLKKIAGRLLGHD